MVTTIEFGGSAPESLPPIGVEHPVPLGVSLSECTAELVFDPLSETPIAIKVELKYERTEDDESCQK